jgi:hypothetical protein
MVGFRVQGSGYRVNRVKVEGFRALGLGFRV